LESWTIANSWTREPATGRILSPAPHALTLATAGWPASTKGPVRGRVIGVVAEKVEDLEQYRGKLKGAIVVVDRPAEEVDPKNPLLTPWGEGTIPLSAPKREKPIDFETVAKLRQARTKFLADEGVAAVL